MRVLILTDRDFTLREHAMLRRLEVGLADEGVRVIRAAPSDLIPDLGDDVFAHLVPYEDRGFPFTRSVRAAKLVEAAAAAPGKTGERPIDVIHVFGDRAWPIGVEAARLAGAALAVELIGLRSLPGLAAIKAEAERGLPVLVIAPDPVLQRRVGAETAGQLTARSSPWGVHTAGPEREILPVGGAPALLLVASGEDPASVNACLDGLATVAARHRDCVFFVDADAAHKVGAWRTITRLKLADRTTLIPSVERFREPALRADILLLPEALGDHRTITLDAMAAGMAVVATADQAISCLIDQQTARLVKSPVSQGWSSAVGELLDHPPTARTLARGGREYVAREHKISARVVAMLDAYEWLAGGGASIPYRSETGAGAGSA